MDSPELCSADVHSNAEAQRESCSQGVQAMATDDNEDVFVSKTKMAEKESGIPDLWMKNPQVNTEGPFGVNLRRKLTVFPCQEELIRLSHNLQTSANPWKDVLRPGPGKNCSQESDDKDQDNSIHASVQNCFQGSDDQDADNSIHASVQDKSVPETTRVVQGSTGAMPGTTGSASGTTGTAPKTTGAETEDHSQTDTQAKRDLMGINMADHCSVTANPPEPDKDTPADKLIHKLEKQCPNLKKEDLDSIKRLIHPNLISNQEIFPFLKLLQGHMKSRGIKILKTLHICIKDMNNVQESLPAEFEKKNFFSLYQNKDLSGYKFVLVPLRVVTHWILLVADVNSKTICLLDSSINSSLEKDKWIDLWKCLGIGSSLKIKWKVGELESGKQDRSPDNDQSSCGAFLMLNAFLIVHGSNPSSCTLQDAIDFRMYVLVCIITERFAIPMPGLNLCCSYSGCTVQSANQLLCRKCSAWLHLSCVHPEPDCKERQIQRDLLLKKKAHLTTTSGQPVMQPESGN